MNRVLSIVVILFLLSACSLTQIKPEYIPQKDVAPINGSENVIVEVIANDLRDPKSGSADEIYDMGVSSRSQFESSVKLAELFKSAIEIELANRGLKVAPGRVKIECIIRGFSFRYQEGFWVDKAITFVGFELIIKDAKGDKTFSELISGQCNRIPSITIFGMPRSAEIGLGIALQNAMKSLFDKPEFYLAIQKANSSYE
jgi:uncharacterized lipoprotein YajG